MAKRSINLLIKGDKEKPLIQKLRVLLPLIAAISFVVFIAGFAATYMYINTNITRYKLLKQQADQLEKSISSQKNTEGIYTLTLSILDVIGQLKGLKKNHEAVYDKLVGLQDDGVTYLSVTSDDKGNVQLSVTASTVHSLQTFYDSLRALDEHEHLFSSIESQGVLRDKSGQYSTTIAMKASKTIL